MRNIWFDSWDAIKRYARFEPGEWKGFLITIVVLAFIVSFNDWGVDRTPDYAVGLVNFLGAVIIVTLSLFGRTWVQKIVGAVMGYRTEYKPTTSGLLFAVVLAFISGGRFWFLIPGGIVVHFMAGQRLGWAKYMLSPFGLGVVSIFGPIANILLAMVFRVLHEFTGVELFYSAFILNILWALWTLTPIPPSDGSRMFFGSRMAYMWCIGLVVASAVLLFYSELNIFITILLSFLFAWVWWLIYYLVWERYFYKGY
ncbi:hypothetical protein J4419_03850 [Candidatus Woesearchaeota archaeon]|nr:hypothetical protein [Candidatus Woesearchaeota archaeon]